LRFILKRAGTSLITVFIVSVFSFIAFNVIRGDPATLVLGTNATAEQIESLREQMNLNLSLPARYFQWIGNFLSGNLGYSLRFQGESISSLILNRLPVSITLALLSLFFMLLIALPVSLFSVHRKSKIAGKIINFCTAIGIGIPNFFLGIFFIWFFGIVLRLFSPGVYIKGDAAGLIFPALAIAVPNAAILIKFLRSSLSKELYSDYIRTAYSKGASHFIVLSRHALRNAIIPAITVLGMIIADIFSGSIIIEQVFSIPGIGQLLIAAINSRDYPLIQILVMYIAFVVIIANTIVDIVIQLVDPRIRLERNYRQ